MSFPRLANEKKPLTRHIYAFLSGPYENVGDALIRRRAIAWARTLGEPHLLMGGAHSASWDEALALNQGDTIYRSRTTWLRSVLLRSGRKPVLLIEPGEFNTDKRFYKLLVVLFLVSLVVRARGGSVVQMPRSMARQSRLGMFLYRATVSRSGTVLWREEPSWQTFNKIGAVVPDIGFDDPDSVPPSPKARDGIVISLRSDRPEPDVTLLDWLRDFAAEHSLTITAVSQVAEDDSRTQFLAERLGASKILWANRTSNEQEAILRTLYAETTLVWSDRLHVLVLGALHGAVPIEIVPAPNGKIPKHFDAVGIRGVSYDAVEVEDRESLSAILKAQLAKREGVDSSIAKARLALTDSRTSLLSRV